MIIDCFPFFNELDVLEIRLNELNSVVDKFVLVEADRTQSLLPKPYYFEGNKERFSKFIDKIVHIKHEMPESSGWGPENSQRNAISDGLALLLISDLDEIPSKELIKDIDKNSIHSVEMEFFIYFLNLKVQDRNWVGSVVGPYSEIIKKSPQGWRDIKDFLPRESGGWHFSWLGGAKKVYEKALSCIEPLDKGMIPTYEEFERSFQENINKKEHRFIHPENLSLNSSMAEKDYPNISVSLKAYPQHLL
jgi:beta-1,4-mannosyl-glycoprotein beta-1,4-N-acetylglucosaminyltransferase